MRGHGFDRAVSLVVGRCNENWTILNRSRALRYPKSGEDRNGTRRKTLCLVRLTPGQGVPIPGLRVVAGSVQ